MRCRRRMQSERPGSPRSHSAAIIPILIATEASESAELKLYADADKVYRPIHVHPGAFRQAIDLGLQTVTDAIIDNQKWQNAPYRPTPTIVEAARALYAQHSVEAIARYDAGAQNLRVTSSRIEELVDEAKAKVENSSALLRVFQELAKH